jgi:hypothetical protein
MPGTHARRWSIASGILVVVLLVASFMALGASPGEGAPPDAVMRSYADHRSGHLLAGYLTLLAVMVFLVFIAGLRAAVRTGASSEEEAAATLGFAAGIAFVPLTIIGYGADIVLASSAAAGNPLVFEAVRDIEGAAIGISDLPLAVSLAAFSIAMLTTHSLPRWLGWFGFLPAAALFAGSFAPLAAPLGGIGFLGFLLFLLWSLAAGIVALWRGVPPPHQIASTAPAAPVLR